MKLKFYYLNHFLDDVLLSFFANYFVQTCILIKNGAELCHLKKKNKITFFSQFLYATHSCNNLQLPFPRTGVGGWGGGGVEGLK